MATTPTVWIVLKTSATLVPGSENPTNPYYNLLDIVPNGMPNDVPEAKANYRYTVSPAPRIGEQTKEVWNVKIEYSGCANDNLEIAGWAYDKSGAGKMLDKGVIDHIGPMEEANNLQSGKLWRIHTDLNTYHSEYVILEEHSTESEDVWYCWDIIEVKLESTKTSEVKDSESENERVEEMKDREEEGSEMARRRGRRLRQGMRGWGL
jgi:uncharacterized protein (DUF2235 family)